MYVVIINVIMSGCRRVGFPLYFCFQSSVSHGYLLHSHYFVSPLKILFIYRSKKKKKNDMGNKNSSFHAQPSAAAFI